MNEQLPLSLSDGVVFRFELEINLSLFFDVEKVCGHHLSERIDCLKHRLTFNTGTLFENEELTGVIVRDLIQRHPFFHSVVENE